MADLPADGIVVSSPTGSTAYFLSAGGPIMAPSPRSAGHRAHLSHTLFSRPLIVRGRTHSVTVPRGGPERLFADGRPEIDLPGGSVVNVVRPSGRCSRLFRRSNVLPTAGAQAPLGNRPSSARSMPTRMTAKTAPKGRLRSLTVEGFGLIDARPPTSAPANAFTGETGSGKSMVIDALGFAFGGRAGSNVVRVGAARASAFVELSAPEAASWLAEKRLLRRRLRGRRMLVVSEVTAAGRSSARINGSRPPRASFANSAESCSTSSPEAQVLLQPARHLAMLDAYAGDAALLLRDQCRGTVSALRALQAEMTSLRGTTRDWNGGEDARFAAREIAAAKLQEANSELLRERRVLLANAARMRSPSEAATDALADGDRGAVSGLSGARRKQWTGSPRSARSSARSRRRSGLQSATQDVTASRSRR